MSKIISFYDLHPSSNFLYIFLPFSSKTTVYWFGEELNKKVSFIVPAFFIDIKWVISSRSSGSKRQRNPLQVSKLETHQTKLRIEKNMG